jgi:hypothetical protein
MGSRGRGPSILWYLRNVDGPQCPFQCLLVRGLDGPWYPALPLAGRLPRQSPRPSLGTQPQASRGVTPERCRWRGGFGRCAEVADRQREDVPEEPRSTYTVRKLRMPRTRKNGPSTPPSPPAFPGPAIASDRLLGDSRALIAAAREQTVRAVNSALVGLYWHIGTCIREDVLNNKRAGYGAEIVSALGRGLTLEYGRSIWSVMA